MRSKHRTPTDTSLSLLATVNRTIEALRPFGCEADMTLEQWSDIIWDLIEASCKAQGLRMPSNLDDWPRYDESANAQTRTK